MWGDDVQEVEKQNEKIKWMAGGERARECENLGHRARAKISNSRWSCYCPADDEGSRRKKRHHKVKTHFRFRVS